MFAFVLPMILGIMLIGRLFSGWFQHRPAGEIVDTGLVIPESILANPPTWSLVLAAGAVSILILGICAFVVIQWIAFRKHIDQQKHELAALQAEQEALVAQAADTAARIRQGNPLQGEVIRCYQEMDRLLSRRRNIKPTYLTPREFTDSLQELGIRTEHVQELTALFELVRYGGRDDQSMAQQALVCLDKLQTDYATEEDCERQG